MTEKYTLTPEHRAQLKPWADKWIANAFNTTKMDAAEVLQSKEHVIQLYKAANLKPPSIERVTFVSSTMIGAIVWGISSGVTWLRNKPERHKELFGAELSKDEMQHAKVLAVEHCCKIMFGEERLLQVNEAHLALSEVLGVPEAESKEVHKDVVKFLIGCVSRWSAGYNAGKDWSGWPAFLSFFRHVVKLPLDYEAWAPYEELSKVGPRFMHEEFAVLCDRQAEIHTDPENLPHNEFGAAIVWRCGTKAYYWHGTSIPADWIEKKSELKAATILQDENMERRRAGCELVGWPAILQELKAVSLNKHEDPEIGELVKVDLPDSPNELFLRVLEGHSGREFAYSIPRDLGIETAQQAQNWVWSMPEGQDYAPAVRA